VASPASRFASLPASFGGSIDPSWSTGGAALEAEHPVALAAQQQTRMLDKAFTINSLAKKDS
jgi:hypothetical protein